MSFLQQKTRRYSLCTVSRFTVSIFLHQLLYQRCEATALSSCQAVPIAGEHDQHKQAPIVELLRQQNSEGWVSRANVV